jgi:hypothetical protein
MCHHQFCKDYYYLQNSYYFSDTFNEFFKFQKKYHYSFKEIDEYIKLQEIDDTEEKFYQFLTIALAIKNELHPSPINEKLYTIIEE